ncbi:hypothetical protein LCGC14_3138550, partial [marine sediment metagenome]
MKILVIHGPNLDILGTREPEVYGKTTLAEINKRIRNLVKEEGGEVRIIQSHHEGKIVEEISNSKEDVLVINPAAYTHTS